MKLERNHIRNYLKFCVFRIAWFFMVKRFRGSVIATLRLQLLPPLLFECGSIPLLQVRQGQTGQDLFLSERKKYVMDVKRA